METKLTHQKTACVVGGTGFVASTLIKLLLDRGYAVNTTVRDPDNEKKISHLISLQEFGKLKIFKANLTDAESFDAPIAGCKFVFHVATPVNFASDDPENEMIKPAIQGVRNVMNASAKAKTVKRVILTSSAAAVTINNESGVGLVMNENNWTDVDYLTYEKPPTWGYAVSKTLAEKEGSKLAAENNVELVIINASLMCGACIAPYIPNSVEFTASMITGNEFFIQVLKGIQILSGSISITHVEDVCHAHIFLAEKESASGRYICSCVNTTVPELAKFLSNRYPQYKVPTDFGDFPTKSKVIISSEKLISEGFSFEYGIEEMFDQTLDYLKGKGLLK